MEASRIISVLGTSRRRDRWLVAARTRVLAALGAVELDLRQAEADGPEVAMDVVCVFGRVTVLVPEGADVELSGFSFLASSDSRVTGPAVDAVPKVRIRATAVIAKVRVRSEPGRTTVAAPPLHTSVDEPEPASEAA